MGGTLAGLAVIALLAGATALRTRRRLNRLETLIRRARTLATGGMSFRPVDATWQAALEGIEVPPDMIALGDFVEVPEGGEPSGALRGFADAEGTTYGWLARTAAGRPVLMVLVSATDTDVYL